DAQHHSEGSARERVHQQDREDGDGGNDVLDTGSHGFISSVLMYRRISSRRKPRPWRKRTCRPRSRSLAGGDRKRLFHTASRFELPSSPAARKPAAMVSSSM